MAPTNMQKEQKRELERQEKSTIETTEGKGLESSLKEGKSPIASMAQRKCCDLQRYKQRQKKDKQMLVKGDG